VGSHRRRRCPPVNLSVAASVFPLVALGELPDKTMFASLLLASRGRPVAVWAGATAAFTVHVVIAVSIGVALFALLPHRVVDFFVAGLFLLGAGYSWHTRHAPEEDAEVAAARSGLRTAATAASVIFLAEWGDLTQVITADLAARYHAPLSVGAGALAALVVVAALAVAGGRGLLGRLPVPTLRVATAVVLTALGVYTLGQALAG
jgi:putative Ca2+/H+ antiporter (TMEM165/GDT1 family)